MQKDSHNRQIVSYGCLNISSIKEAIFGFDSWYVCAANWAFYLKLHTKALPHRNNIRKDIHRQTYIDCIPTNAHVYFKTTAMVCNFLVSFNLTGISSISENHC